MPGERIVIPRPDPVSDSKRLEKPVSGSQADRQPDREPTWKSAPEWKFWLSYLEDMATRSVEPPEIRSFRHIPPHVRENDEERLLRLRDMVDARMAGQRKRREAGEFTEKQLADRELQFSLGPTGHLLERVLTDLIERYDLLGGVAIRASSFDDHFNGVDAIIEWPHEESNGTFPRLAVDFSVAGNAEAISHKRTRTSEGARVKYFRSHYERERGRPVERDLFIPAVVIRVSRDALKQLAKDAAESSLDAVIATHPVRESILRQVEDQLVAQGVQAINYLHKRNPDDPGLTLLSDRMRQGEGQASVVDGLYAYSGDELDRLTGNSRDTDRMQDILDVLAMTRRASIPSKPS